MTIWGELGVRSHPSAGQGPAEVGMTGGLQKDDEEGQGDGN